MLGSGWGGGAGQREISRCSGAHGSCGGRWERFSVFCCLCCVFSLSVSLLFLFPLFAVLWNCFYPDPRIFCLFLSIPLHTPAGGGAAMWRFCCQPRLNYTGWFFDLVWLGFFLVAFFKRETHLGWAYWLYHLQWSCSWGIRFFSVSIKQTLSFSGKLYWVPPKQTATDLANVKIQETMLIL